MTRMSSPGDSGLEAIRQRRLRRAIETHQATVAVEITANGISVRYVKPASRQSRPDTKAGPLSHRPHADTPTNTAASSDPIAEVLRGTRQRGPKRKNPNPRQHTYAPNAAITAPPAGEGVDR